MLIMKQCCTVPFPERLSEQYEVSENAVYANIGADKITDVMKRFIEMHDEPLFFILEIPSKKSDETETAPNVVADLSDDIYYLDGCDREYALHILEAVGHFLIKDGLNTFGFGGHISNEEILFGRYNVTTFYTSDTEKYKELFADFGIERTEKLLTAWDTFGYDHPGRCSKYESEGITIYDLPEKLAEHGLYFAERRINGEPQPITFADLRGKVMLVGVTYYSRTNEFTEQKQFWGTVIRADENGVVIEQSSGETMCLPPDLSSVNRAHPGDYTLHSTGETVKNPDFLSTWNITKEL